MFKKKVQVGAVGVALTLVIGVLAAGPQTSASTVSKSFHPVQASYVSQEHPEVVHNTYDWLATCPQTCGKAQNSKRNSFISFSVTGIPSGAKSVNMALTMTPRTDA